MTDSSQTAPLWQSVLDFSSSEWQTPFGAITVTAWDGMGVAAALDAGLTMAKAADVISWAEQQRAQLTNLVNATESLIASGKLSAIEQIEVQLMKNTFSANALQFDDMAKGMGSALGTYLSGAQVLIAIQTNDQYEVGKTAFSSFLGMGAGSLAVEIGKFALGAKTLPAIALTMIAAAIVGFAAGKVGEYVWAEYADLVGLQHTNDWSLKQGIADIFTAATQPIYYDPLALDLDNDGIETVGINGYNSVLFDHNADGLKTATGWVAADDGLLAIDRNGNGSIDNGRELFGIDYLKQNGQLATDGFDALRDLDSNADNVFDANDSEFANVRVWLDLNQDGVSQANELFTLEQLNIQSIALNASQQTVNLGNGNQQTAGALFTRTDGSTGTAGNLDFSQNSFYRSFADAIDTTGLDTLPTLHGAGAVRDLREAAALSPALAQLLTDFAAADRVGQQGLLDQILKAWSDTSPMAATFTGAYAGHTLTVNIQNVSTGSAAYTAWADKLTILEHFNGRTFNAAPAKAAANDKTWSMAA